MPPLHAATPTKNCAPSSATSLSNPKAPNSPTRHRDDLLPLWPWCPCVLVLSFSRPLPVLQNQCPALLHPLHRIALRFVFDRERPLVVVLLQHLENAGNIHAR